VTEGSSANPLIDIIDVERYKVCRPAMTKVVWFEWATLDDSSRSLLAADKDLQGQDPVAYFV
jgi:hypothetical protein